ncbi:hypothetical protein HKI87_03g25190 [Chloropicon roscoffensis]|uniref:C2 domain-containing protein n=1 Tax=Chloropicon roscoffensis TaxID=1461544 RepID=A0AAX4P3N4_9CHLO
MATLRLAVTSVRTMVAHQYYFILCLHDAQLDPGRADTRGSGLDPKLSGTSDVSELTTNPEFKNRTFYFSVSGGEGVTSERYLKESSLTCQLYATDAAPPGGASTSYGGPEHRAMAKKEKGPLYTDQLIESSTHRLTEDEVARLSSGGGDPVPVSFKFGEVAVMHVDATLVSSEEALATKTTQRFLGDLFDSQRALSQLQLQSRHNSEESDRLRAQCSGLTYQNRLLQDEVEEMRGILDQERKAAKAAPSLEGWEEMPPQELRQRAEQSIALFRKEQTRNAELVHQMKRMHSKAVEHENDMRRYHELQDAHAAQSKQIADFERENARVDQYKSTCKTQEKIIAKMEKVLQANLGYKDKMQRAEAELARVREESERIKEQARHNELEAARAEVMTLEGSKEEQHVKLVESEKTKLAMTMRAEKAEVRAMAARNELIEATKRFAHEISTLKARLAEKDAQLLGGFNAKFGPLSNNFSTTTNASRSLSRQGATMMAASATPAAASPAPTDERSPDGSTITDALGKEGSVRSQIAPEGPEDKAPERNSPSPTTTLEPENAEEAAAG